MSREDFIDNLRFASRMLLPPKVSSGQGSRSDERIGAVLQSADLWLTRRSVQGFEPADFSDWPEQELEKLKKDVAAFLALAEQVPPRESATRAQSTKARRHLERAIETVRSQLLPGWLEAQSKMEDEAAAAAKEKGWYVEKDEKEVLESLLGSYGAPRLRIRTRDGEVIFDPIARFGSGRKGIVDLVVMPTYETAYLITFNDGEWQIVPRHGAQRSKPFSGKAIVKTIADLTHS
jgi:hypothetical protein